MTHNLQEFDNYADYIPEHDCRHDERLLLSKFSPFLKARILSGNMQVWA